jgi:predicted N-acyltransferase
MSEVKPSEMVARIATRIGDIDAGIWDALANPEPESYDPFISHAFLNALEEAQTVGDRRTGWVPQHIVIEDQSGSIAGCMPCYAKLNSSGEFVFDHAWADAYERAGGHYYPKLQVAVPFTPVTGRRLLVAPGRGVERRRGVLASAAAQIAGHLDVSSLHLTFLNEDEWNVLGEQGYLLRTDKQFHWQNEGYKTFDDFLSQLASRKRKTVRKERQEARSGGIVIERLSGSDIKEAHWDAFFEFYMDTGSRKWGRPYLNRRFFSLLGEALADRCLLVMARNGARYIGGALNLIGGDRLLGRYWGTIEHQPFLHFEVCYYQAIEYAIEHGLARVEGGAQGEHKIARGYMPATTYSAHWIADPGLRRAIARYLEDERRAVAAHGEALAELGPYRRDRAREQD